MNALSFLRPSWRFTVISLVCGLTLAASGDDVCLLCLAAPSLSKPLADRLSLDDPNTDFTAPDGSAPDVCQPQGILPETPLFVAAPTCSPCLSALTTPLLSPRASTATPLRC